MMPDVWREQRDDLHLPRQKLFLLHRHRHAKKKKKKPATTHTVIQFQISQHGQFTCKPNV